ncbi:hypothetical protein BDV26DRAFT_291877 [Aspergillus bertholletiae]|uniref:Uncharacterized protein n=1 Tax=Aspergillus bertholletiae TaxID=1226010 RepID=A0A5N7BAG4_9EURO|nr:hypothetical protein BDV26DRAFT_291877 [Aspergillus bertholletiae]
MVMDQYTQTIPKQVLNEALRPLSSFDWAEDVEEVLEQSQRLQSSDNSDRETEPDDIFEEQGDIYTDVSSANISAVCGEYHNADGDKTSDKKTELELPIEIVPVSGLLTLTTSLIPNFREYDEDDPCSYGEIEQMNSEVEQEFTYRNYCMEHDEYRQIHHFNWLGYPIYESSGTSPAISLLFQLADPKTPSPRDELRFQSVFARAMRFVDPVIVELEKGLEDLERQGLDLVRWATGRVTRFYSLHGRWTEDRVEWDECKYPDEGTLALYQSGSVACGNGFISLCNIRSRHQWGSHKIRLQEKYEKTCRDKPDNFNARRQCNTYKPSLLRQSMKLGSFERTAEDHTETLCDNPAYTQECDRISNGFLAESVEGHCDVQCTETDTNARRIGTQQTQPQRLGILTTANQVTNTIEVYHGWQNVTTSQLGTDSTDTWEALSRTPDGRLRAASAKKGRLGRWKYNLRSWKVTLKGRMNERRRSMFAKAQKVFRKRQFVRSDFWS